MKLWDEKKNKEIKARHGTSFEELLSEGRMLAIERHPKYPDQVRLIFEYQGYGWVIVYEPNRERYVTAWPSRKATKEYLK